MFINILLGIMCLLVVVNIIVLSRLMKSVWFNLYWVLLNLYWGYQFVYVILLTSNM